jgi:hypothetical protein
MLVGDKVKKDVYLGEEVVGMFSQLSGDNAKFHKNLTYCNKHGFEKPIVYGFLLGSYFSEILGMKLPGEGYVIHSVLLNFKKHIYVGSFTSYEAVVTKIVEGIGVVSLDLKIRVNGETHVDGKAQCVRIDPIAQN